MDAPKRTIKRARALRRTMTPPELRLWVALRQRKHGDLRFRRQHPFGPYILDFYCDSARLAVEVDSEIHAYDDNPRRDAFRDHWLLDQGVRTFRIPALEVRDNLDGVVLAIVLMARGEWEG